MFHCLRRLPGSGHRHSNGNRLGPERVGGGSMASHSPCTLTPSRRIGPRPGFGAIHQPDGPLDDPRRLPRRRPLGVAPRQRDEVVVPHLDRDRQRVERVPLEPAGRAFGHPRNLVAHLSAVAEVFRERVFGTRGLRVAMRFDATLVDPVGELRQPLAQAPHEALQALRLDGPHVHEPMDASVLQFFRGLGPDAPQCLHGQLREEVLDALRRNDREPVRLLPARGDLGEELVRCDAG